MSNQKSPAQPPQSNQPGNPVLQTGSPNRIDFAQKIKNSLRTNQVKTSPRPNNFNDSGQQVSEQHAHTPSGQKSQHNQPNRGARSDIKQSRDAGINQSTTQRPNVNQAQSSEEKSDYFPNRTLEESRVVPGAYKPLPEEPILTWKAPSRPFKKHNKKYFSTITVIALLISLILGFAGQLVAVTVVIAVTFLIYALSVTPPQEIENQISTYGIRLANNLYYWGELGRFWLTEKYGQDILNVETIRFPGRITLLLTGQDKELITQVLSEVLLNQKPDLTLYEKISDWLQEKVPLDVDT